MESSLDPIIQHTDEAWANSLLQLSHIPIGPNLCILIKSEDDCYDARISYLGMEGIDKNVHRSQESPDILAIYIGNGVPFDQAASSAFQSFERWVHLQFKRLLC